MKEMIGRLLGNRYEIVKKIGTGGMATVYKGTDLKLNRSVAIKVLYEQFASDPEFLRRFQLEAKAAAKLSHSAIVNVYDEGEEEGIHYIIMEYVDGQTLKDVILSDGPLEPEEAVRIALPVCDALVHAHENNVIHRDIKPHNIIIAADGRVKVTDFGIARAVADSTITYDKSMLGSVYYSSPEQARGSRADQQSDIYSFGIVLYEMLTATVPFSGESPVSIALKHLQEDIIPPSRVVSGLPSTLEMIVSRAVRKDRSLRYQNAAQLRDDLEDWYESRIDEGYAAGPSVQRTRSLPYRGNRSWNSHHNEDEEAANSKALPYRKLLLYVSIAAALFVAVVVGYSFLYSYLVVPEVTVPDLVGSSIEDAEKELSLLGLDYSIARQSYSEDVALDHVISQDPPAGRNVRKERTIELAVSLGPEQVEVPDLTKRTELEARLILNEAGLEMEVSSEYSDDVAPGYVIRQDPGKDFRLGSGETVKVVISKGKKPFSLRNFQGWTLSDVQEWLNLYGLVMRNVEEEPSDTFAEGQVVSQYPAPGDTVQEGDPVDLVISLGKEPETGDIHQVEIQPRVAVGQVIKVYIDDDEGERLIFEGAYKGQIFRSEGYGSGRVVVMELRNDEYYTIDTRFFP